MFDARLEFIAVLLMAVATYATRMAGLLLMRAFVPTPRVESVLRHLSGSVLAALAAPAVLRGDVAMAAGVSVALAVMVTTRRSLLALLAGVGSAALMRAMQ